MILPSLVVSLKQGRISSQHLDHMDSLLRLHDYKLLHRIFCCAVLEYLKLLNIDPLPIIDLTTLVKPLKGNRILTVLTGREKDLSQIHHLSVIELAKYPGQPA